MSSAAGGKGTCANPFDSLRLLRARLLGFWGVGPCVPFLRC